MALRFFMQKKQQKNINYSCSCNVHYTLQVIAVGPGQIIKENEWGLFPMYTMEVTRNDSGLAAFIGEGRSYRFKSRL